MPYSSGLDLTAEPFLLFLRRRKKIIKAPIAAPAMRQPIATPAIAPVGTLFFPGPVDPVGFGIFDEAVGSVAREDVIDDSDSGDGLC